MEHENEQETECRFVRLLPDGTPVVRIGDEEREIQIDGIQVPQPPPPLYIEIFTGRVAQTAKPLRCVVRSEPGSGRLRARLMCFGWKDKSGDVWLDLATVLLQEGVVNVAGAEFPGREEYLRPENKRRPHEQGK